MRDFNIASVNLLIGLWLVTFGVVYGSVHWIRGYQLDGPASPGTVMLAALPIVLGWQALLSFVHLDVANIPRQPLQRVWPTRPPAAVARMCHDECDRALAACRATHLLGRLH